jgi:hypothetical protein
MDDASLRAPPTPEFSIAIAGLAAGSAVEEDLGAVTVTYVLLTVVLGAVVTKAQSRVRTDGNRPTRPAATDEGSNPTPQIDFREHRRVPWMRRRRPPGE